MSTPNFNQPFSLSLGIICIQMDIMGDNVITGEAIINRHRGSWVMMIGDCTGSSFHLTSFSVGVMIIGN
jgi:hypothetical protein